MLQLNDRNGKCEELTCKLTRSQCSHATIWIACKKINASRFVAPTTLMQNVVFHLHFVSNCRTLQHGLCATAHLPGTCSFSFNVYVISYYVHFRWYW